MNELLTICRSLKLAEDMRTATQVAEAVKPPEVEQQEVKAGQTLGYRDTPATAEHRPDKHGGAPGVEVGKPNPDRPKEWAGLPQWEKGREPRRVKLLRRKRS